MSSKKRILILCPSPRDTAATQRLKYEQYLNKLEESGYEFTISSFQTDRFWKIIYNPGRIPEKVFWTWFGYLRRTWDLLRSPFYSGVFVNLWVTPLGSPVYEYLLFLFNKKVIYDIDDMLFLNNKASNKLSFIQKLKGIKKGNSLIVGHSNTVDDIVNKLCGETKIPGDLPDSEYDNLYIVTKKGKRMKFENKTYGTPTN